MKAFAIDLETTGLSPITDKIVGIALTDFEGNPRYYKYEDIPRDILKNLLNDPMIIKIAHNAVFDFSFLAADGLYNPDKINNIHDTMIFAWLLDTDRPKLGLKDLSLEFLGPESCKFAREIWAWLGEEGLTKEDLAKAPTDLLQAYAKEDVSNTFQLWLKFKEKLKKTMDWLQERSYTLTPAHYYNDEVNPLLNVLIKMKLNGVKIDLDLVAKMQKELKSRINELQRQLPYDDNTEKVEKFLHKKLIAQRLSKNKSGKLKKEPPVPKFNYRSGTHLKHLFYDIFKEKVTKLTLKGTPSVDSSVLEVFAKKYPFCAVLLELRDCEKLSSTYLDNLLSQQLGGRIYANFNITGTATGRFSSNNPNLQNLPKHGDIKKLFVPEKGNVFIYADYSQLELRLAAHMSQDKLLLKVYHDNLDLHQMTADILNVDRALGKTVNFAIIYNASGWRLAEILGYFSDIPETDMEAKSEQAKKGNVLIDKLYGKYKGLQAYFEKQINIMESHRIMTTPFGLIRRLRHINDPVRRVRNHDLKAGFNLPIQGFGASICKRAMIEISNQGFTIVNQIHDAIICEVAIKDAELAIARIKDIMENVVQLSVPLIVEPKILKSFQESDIYE